MYLTLLYIVFVCHQNEKNYIGNMLVVFVRPPRSMEGKGVTQIFSCLQKRTCTSHLFNTTQHIEDGYQRGMITDAAFADLYVAYDAVNHRILIQKLYNITQYSQLC